MDSRMNRCRHPNPPIFLPLRIPPLPWLDAGLAADVVTRVAQPVVAEMAHRGTPFVGLLYVGLAVTPLGPRVIEFNARFGDPETQVILMRLKSDLLTLLEAVALERLGELPETAVVWDPQPAVCVVMCSGGYPGKYDTGKLITGLDEVGEQLVEDLGVAPERVAERGALLDRVLDVAQDAREDPVRLLAREDLEALDQREPRIDHRRELTDELDDVLRVDARAERDLDREVSPDLHRAELLRSQPRLDRRFVGRVHDALLKLARPSAGLPSKLSHGASTS